MNATVTTTLAQQADKASANACTKHKRSRGIQWGARGGKRRSTEKTSMELGLNVGSGVPMENARWPFQTEAQYE